MRAVALADGETGPETRLLEAAARLLGVEGPIAPLDPSTLAAVDLDETDRHRVVQAAVLMALMDERVDASEVACVRSIAAALGVDEPRVRNLAQVVRGRVGAPLRNEAVS